MRRERFFTPKNCRRAAKNTRALLFLLSKIQTALLGSVFNITVFFKNSWSKRFVAIALVVAIAAGGLVFLNRPGIALGQTYNLIQNDWSGGVLADTVSAPSNLSGWNKYASASGVTAGAGSVALTQSQTTFNETFTATTNKDAGNTSATWNTSGSLSNGASTGTNLTTVFTNSGITNRSILASVHDQANGLMYLAADRYSSGWEASLAVYNIGANTVTDLTASSGLSAFPQFSNVTMAMEAGKVYMAGYNLFAVYDPDTGIATDLYPSSGMDGFVSDITYIVADPVQHKIYVGAYYGEFVVFDVGTGIATRLRVTSGLSGYWTSAYDNALTSMTYDAVTGKIYLGGNMGQFAVYDPGTGVATNLRISSGLSVYWGTAGAVSIVIPSNGKVYLFSNNTKLAIYDPGTGVATNSTTASGLNAFAGNTISSAAYDSVGGKVYLGSFYMLLSYAIDVAGSVVDVNASVSDLNAFVNNHRIYTLAMDLVNKKLYIGTEGPTFGTLNIASDPGNAVSLSIDATSQNIASATLTKNDTPGTGSISYQLSNNGGSTYATVTPTSLYNFATTGSDLRFKIIIGGNATVQDISISYNYYLASGELVSSKFDSVDATNIVNELIWIENASLPAGTGATVSLRTADSSVNLTGAWTDLTNASANCAKNTGTVTCSAAALPAGMQDGSGDRWFQYKVALTSTGINTPVVSSVGIQFVINAPPEVRNVIAAQNANGTVTISYEVRDVDTQYGSLANQDHITPMFEYWNGATYQTITTLAAGDTSVKAVAHDGSWNNVTYTATWTAATDYNGHYQNNTAKVRVTANDGEGANPTGSAESATYSLDTLVPSSATIYVDASTSPNPTVHLAETEDNPGTMKVSSTDPTLGSTSPEAFSATKTMALSEGATVYAKFTDAYSNSTNVISTTLPATPTAMVIQDISNVSADPHVYRMFVAWKAVVGSFASYRIHRSTSAADPALWPEVDSVALQATNYYVDNNVVQDGTYYYYVETVDGNNNVSFRSSVVSGTADGAVSGGEGGGGIAPPPVISLVSPGTPLSTQATISWETDTLSNSVVEYAIAALNTAPPITTVTVGSLVNNEAGVGSHSVILAGLDPEETYYYRVSSTDINDQTATANNGGAGYSFTTPAGPVITGTVVEQTTNTTARVSWMTDISATTQLVHSIHPDMTEPTVTTGTSDPTAAHIVNLTNLAPETQYFFYVKSVDGSLNETTDKNILNGVARYYSFTTTNDSTPPEITGVSVRVQPTSVDVIWTTSEIADSQVEYGLTNAYGTSTTLDTSGTMRHVVTILNLVPQTSYSYRIRSRDNNSVLSTSANYTFTTSQAGDDTPPVISGVSITSLSLNSASINWTTDEGATSYIDYGLTTDLGSASGTADLVSAHSITLTALAGNTQYYYRVRSTDTAGNAATDNNLGAFYTFTTSADGTAPVVSNLDDIVLMNSFRVIWSTNELADSQVEYGPDAGYGSTTTLDDTLVLDHSVTVTALSAATSYHYRIKTRDASGNLTTGADRVVTTAAQADADPPVITVVASSLIERTTATVTWTTDEKSGSEVQYGPNISFGYSSTNINDNTQSHSVDLSGLTPGTQYYFKVISTDGSGNIASADNSAAGYTFTTIVDDTPPVITGVGTALVSDVSAVVTWTTDEDSSSQVIYGTTTGYGTETAISSDLTTLHSVTITGLTLSTNYYYKVVSVDAYTNSTTNDNTGAGYQFLTTAEPGRFLRARAPQLDTTPPNISNIRIGSVKKDSAIVYWDTDEDSTSIVKFGPTTAYGRMLGSLDDMVMAHAVQLADLAPGTIYHFMVISQDASGNKAQSNDQVSYTVKIDGTAPEISPSDLVAPPGEGEGEGEKPAEHKSTIQIMSMFDEIINSANLTFIPQDSLVTAINEIIDRAVRAPSIVGLAPRVDVAGTTAKISWTTDKNSNGSVAYIKDAQYSSDKNDPYATIVSNKEEFSTLHSVVVENLEPATKYHFQVRSKGLVGAEARSQDMTFTTTSELPVITNLALSEVTDFNATLAWITNIPTNTTVVFKNNATGASLTQGDTAFLRDHNFKIDNLEAGAGYTLVVNVEDEFGNKASSQTISFATSKDTTAPEISKVSSESTLYPGKESRVQTIISWDTNEPATSHVFYQEGLGTDAQVIDVPVDTSPVIRHTVVITKFRPTTVYKFWVESIDASGNAEKSKDFLILTPQQKATVLDIIIKNFEQVFGWTKRL